jgi:hypothetical protein
MASVRNFLLLPYCSELGSRLVRALCIMDSRIRGDGAFL